MDDAVQDYIDAIAPANRPLFDRMHRLILEVRPDAQVVLSYNMPTYEVDGFRVYVASWKHGLSIYGWDQGADGGFVAHHPELKEHKGTIKISPAQAAAIDDDELRTLFRTALGG